MRKLLTFGVFLSFAVFVEAQHVLWKVQPSYTSIEQCAEDLWRVKDADGKVKIIHAEDYNVFTEKYDSITNFSGEYALGLNYINSKWRVKSIINKRDLKETFIAKGIYYTNQNSYFSEGRLSVRNEKGQHGYLNVNGDNVIKCKYSDAGPFFEGKAHVTQKNNKGTYIDDMGKSVSLASRDETSILSTLRAMPEIRYNESYSIYNKGVAYGYKKDSVVVVEPQFEAVYPVSGNYAKVRFYGNSGLIEIKNDTLQYSLDEAGDTSRLALPLATLDAKLLQVYVVDAEGERITVRSEKTETDSIYYELPIDTAWQYRTLQIYYDRLVQTSRELRDKTPKITDEYLTMANPYCGNTRADKNDNVYVVVRVTNNSDKSAEGVITIYIDGRAYARNVELEAGKSRNYSVTVSVKKERYAKVQAKLSNGKQTAVRTMHFTPFY